MNCIEGRWCHWHRKSVLVCFDLRCRVLIWVWSRSVQRPQLICQTILWRTWEIQLKFSEKVSKFPSFKRSMMTTRQWTMGPMASIRSFLRFVRVALIGPRGRVPPKVGWAAFAKQTHSAHCLVSYRQLSCGQCVEKHDLRWWRPEESYCCALSPRAPRLLRRRSPSVLSDTSRAPPVQVCSFPSFKHFKSLKLEKQS